MAVSNISSVSLPTRMIPATNTQFGEFRSSRFSSAKAPTLFKRYRLITCISESSEKNVNMTMLLEKDDVAKSQAGYPFPKAGGRVPNLSSEDSKVSTNGNRILKSDIELPDYDLDINRWLRSSRVQWYPGHIAKAERELKQQLKLMDVVIEVRDARIPMATGHPEMDLWIGDKKKILVLNKVDMISTADKNKWATYFSKQGMTVVLANGQLGMGTLKLARVAKSLANNFNAKRRAKGLLPRATRAGVVGYPNVGKSSLINRLLKRKICVTASRPGVTRELKWVRIGQDLDLLDSPGILPMRFNDQAPAIKLAICDDIGERSYAVTGVAAILVEILKQHPDAGAGVLQNRYKINADCCSGEIFVKALAQRLFNGDVTQAAFRILYDFRKGKFGWIALERPPSNTM
ncbi:hypothetical protein SUGI_1114760 [Cryptomeria japonica]|uniref:DAR GTPase 3, chloroplastic n=1 Tax=Cryptomeria japonica TaxID=3369 RepID=UPI0024147B5C|nr:DAR GTPase 3, chloroplastic [Cryptomeria japonica]GLJ52407.1 hypothetical protein SUGI_1114760 [Cryptomeria japonica]